MNTAIEVLNYYGGQIQFSQKSNELAIFGVGHQEQVLLKHCLVAVGAKPENFGLTDTDENRVILKNAREVAEILSKAGVELAGKSTAKLSP